MTVDRLQSDKPFSIEANISDCNNNSNSIGGNENKVPSVNIIRSVWTFIGDKCERLRYFNFHMKHVKQCGKKLRKTLHLNKSPKKKGYGRFLTDEEKRYLLEFHSLKSTNQTNYYTSTFANNQSER